MPREAGNAMRRHFFLYGHLTPGIGSFFETAAVRWAALLPLAVMLSKSGGEFVKFIVLLCWLFSGCWWRRRDLFYRDPLALAALAFLAVPFLGIFWSAVPLETAARRWFSYAGLWLFPALLTLLTHRDQKSLAIACFNLGMCLLIVYLNLWRLLECCGWTGTMLFTDSYSAYAKGYGPIANFALFWMLFWVLHPYASRRVGGFARFYPATLRQAMNRAARMKWTTFARKRQGSLGRVLFLLRWLIVATIAVYLLYATKSRTAVCCFLAVIAAALIWKYRWKGLLVGVLLLALLITGVYASSSMVRQRTQAIVKEVQTLDKLYSPGVKMQRLANKSSGGTRLILFQTGVIAASLHPAFGWGTGSVALAYATVPGIEGAHDSHCDFTMVLIQWGSVGLTLFLLVFLVAFLRSRSLPPPWGMITFCGLVIILINCLLGSAFSFGEREIFFPYFLGFYLALLPPQKTNRENGQNAAA